MEFDFLITDWMILALFFATLIFIFIARRHPHLREPWKKVFQNRLGMIAFVVLTTYASIGVLDSVHFKIRTQDPSTKHTVIKHKTVLDLLLGPLGEIDERTYSQPFAIHAYQAAWVKSSDGTEKRAYPRLKHAGAHLKSKAHHHSDIMIKILLGFSIGAVSFCSIAILWIYLLARRSKSNFSPYFIQIIKGNTTIAWREAIFTAGFLWILITVLVFLASNYHIFGTNKIGEDVFHEVIKSIRTGLLIGTLATIFMLPFALFFGLLAGYFSGIVDDIIQYLYTTLSSIPGVLLISAMVLVMQVYIANHPALFPTIEDRADMRLLTLCFILGITSWASLCRLLRAETLKIREQDYVTASITMGARPLAIIFRHILPNVMHIVLITIVLDFSGLVLAESILSYVGVGVDPTTASWGNIINTSRLELAREPMVWWPLLAALTVMFFFVLSANIFADAVRDAFDPRLNTGR